MKIGLLSILKFLLALLLLPAVVNVTMAFDNELNALKSLKDLFYYGIITYVIMHLFVFTPIGLFQFWQKIFGDLFKFSAIFSSVVPMIIPLSTTLVLLAFYLLKPVIAVHHVERYVMFAVGFTLAMQIILIAHQLYDEDNNAIKPHYLLSICLIYIINLFLVAALLNLNFDKFSVMQFCKSAGAMLDDTYHGLYHKFLLLKKA